MDSNEMNRPLTDAPAAEAAETMVPSPATPEETNATYVPKQTKEEVIERLVEINQDACHSVKQELDFLKLTFYKLHNAEQEAARKAFVEGGGAPEAFVPESNETEARFKELMKSIKEQRAVLQAQEEKEREDNLAQKLAILDRMKTLTESPEEANKSYQEFKKLQQEWNEVKQVPAAKVNELWKMYQLCTEKFYDLIKLNNEFREYDFKKNLEIKTHLCEAVENLATEKDAVSAFHQLQKFHQEFRNTGPVAKELREQLWARFKAASSAVNRRYIQHFEELKAKEQHNLDEKTVICEIVEAMEYDKMTTVQDWTDKTEEILALQAKWKTIGYAPQKMNTKIFERFRAACNDFFQRKAQFFKDAKKDKEENLSKKKALCEKAEALKDNTDWKETAEVLTQLQKEWKAIGPVPKKHSNTLWKRFITACDYFFEQKNKANSSQRSVEQANLAEKKEVLEKLTALLAEEEVDKNTQEQVRELMKVWNGIGFVPFKDKDKINKQYRELIDKLFDKLNLSNSQKKLKNFKANLGNKELNPRREREKLVRAYEAKKNEIQTYENNLGFLTSSSKKGNSLLNEMNRKVEKLKAELVVLEQKIDYIDQSIQV